MHPIVHRFLHGVPRRFLAGTGFLFLPVVGLTVLWIGVFLGIFAVLGFAETAKIVWPVALFFKVVWVAGDLRGRRVLQKGCQY